MFRQRIADVTKNLLILNIAVWVIGVAIWSSSTQDPKLDINETIGLRYFSNTDFQPWQIVTSMFSHAIAEPINPHFPEGKHKLVFVHILFNMFMLYMFGSHVEFGLGKKKYFILYLISGFGAAFIHQLLAFLGAIDGFTYLVGASGAIFGVLVSFAFMNPNARLMLIIPPIPVKAKILIPILIVVELSLGIQGNTNIAHFAHLGGGLTAFIILLIWKIKPNRY